MKRQGNLYEKICDPENISLALKNQTRGKGKRREVINFLKDSSTKLEGIRRELLDETYKVSKYRIFKKLCSGGKTRIISSLPLKDRIIQWQIIQIIGDIFYKHFIIDTYSSIKGRGVHFGVKRVKQAMKHKENTVYCLKLDIHQFYPSIDKNILKLKIRKRIKDEKLLNLIDIIIDSGGNGIPIGNFISQFFANYFLSDFDHQIKEKLKVKYYFRYMDDMVILHKSKKFLHYLEKWIRWYFEKELNLKVKSNFQIFLVKQRGIDFLGYVFFNDFIKIRKRIKIKLKKRIIKTPSSKPSYSGWLKHCNCVTLKFKYKV